MLQLVCGDKTDREIEEELFISGSTVSNHVSNILNKTDATGQELPATLISTAW